MRSGRKPTPTTILKLRGSRWAKGRDQEPQPAMKRPLCPAWLSTEAKAVWRRVVPVLHGLGLASTIDGLPLTRYCQLYGRWQQIEIWLATHVGEKGYAQSSFAANSLQKELAQIEQNFGMSPQARAGLGIALGKAHGQAQAAEQDDRRFFRMG